MQRDPWIHADQQTETQLPGEYETLLHRGLAHFNSRRLKPGLPTEDWVLQLRSDNELLLAEGRFVEGQRAAIHDRAAAAPTDAEGFLQWFEALEKTGPGQGDPLFPWLARHAELEAMRWFLQQEAAGEAGFDDLVALTQVRFPPRMKLEMARNYWDEMGRGNENGMHGPMLAGMVDELVLKPVIESTAWESLALANLMVAMAINRRYAYHAVGALGAIEMTAPGRAVQVAAGLKRLGVATRGRMYFQLHSTLDVKHSREWNREVIGPLVEADPSCAAAIAEGALMRLAAGARCFDHYRAELGVPVRSLA